MWLSLAAFAVSASPIATLPTAHADAFTSTPYTGNPACVVLLPTSEFPDEVWMQKVANEMHLSETAFLAPRSEPGAYDLRWFTPTDEVDLCGHATLASSHVLWDVHGASMSAPLTFHTRSGVLKASRAADGTISLDFPSEPATEKTRDEYAEVLVRAFGLRDKSEIIWVGRNNIGGPGGGDLIVELSPEAFGRLEPVQSEILKTNCRVLSVTCAGCPGASALPADGPPADAYDFSSRGFGPCVGIDEDPVCGSAHCALGPYWAAKLKKSRFLARVASPRGGDVHVSVEGERVVLGGKAVVTMTGKLLH